MKSWQCWACAATALLPFASADWQFKSRTDLAPPRLNITIQASPDVEKGYLFVAPFPGLTTTGTEMHGPCQEGPYIFRDDGELVWSGYTYYSIWAANFQAARWNGKDVLFSFEGDHNPGYGHGHGHATILDQHYETIRELRAGNHKLMDKHEFHVIDEKTALIQVYQPVPRDLSRWGGSALQQWIVDAVFQGMYGLSWLLSGLTRVELDIETGELLFEWSSLTHVSPDGKSEKRGIGHNTNLSRGNHYSQPRPGRIGLQLVRCVGLFPYQFRGQRCQRRLSHLRARCLCSTQDQRNHGRNHLATRWQAL